MSLVEGLRAIVGSEGVLPDPRAFGVDGMVPQVAVAPQNEEEIAALIEYAAAHRAPFIVWGGGTQVQVGAPPARYDWALSTLRLNRVIEYQPADLIITVQAGMRFAEVQRVLAQHLQWLPWNPPLPEQSTIGGLVASGRSGSWRFGQGTPRDRLLAMRMVGADGVPFKSGAKVVKSVAGYDLHRLFCGSWGTLGIITEITLKVAPMPESRAACCWRVPDYETAESMLASLLESPLRPDSLDLLNAQAAEEVGFPAELMMVMEFSGASEAVAWQQAFLREQGYPLREVSEEQTARLHDLPALDQPVLGRLLTLSSRIVEWMNRLEQAGRYGLYAHAGSGVLYAWGDFPKAAETLYHLCSQGEASLTFLRLPTEEKTRIRVSTPFPPGTFLMKRIKEQFDPQGLFAPGRFFSL